MLGVIGNKFSIGKETYEPFSAELHYFRIDKRYWSICFERIKKAGFRIISTAVPWNIHQSDSRGVDFNGFDDPKKDLVVFLELAREFGFKVILRPGPWVAGQVKFGGLPKFIFNDSKVLARDAAGAEVKLRDDFGVEGGSLPSYLHPNFQFFLRNYFKAFIETTKNYVHPRGPVFMVELDYETSFGRNLDPASADYNPDVLAAHYPSFLEKKYQDVKVLNNLYKEKNADFEHVDPPRKFTDLESKNYPKVLDWFRFREYILNTYLESLEDIFKTYTVEPLMFRSLYFRPGDLIPAFNLVPVDRAPFLGSNVFPEGSYFDLVNKARFLKAEYGFAFAASFASGQAAEDPEREESIAPISNNTRRFYYASGIAAGFKGLNHYMFVNRDHWHGAPLNNDGTVTDGFETAKNFNTTLSTVDFDEMAADPEIAVLGNRLYYWLREAPSPKEFPYIQKLLDDSTVGFCRDLMRLKLTYGVRENRDYESMKKYKMIFVPTTDVMSERDQEGLVELSKSGVILMLCGLMPRFDEELKPCAVLSNHFRIKTVLDYHIGTVTHKNGSFPAYVYSSIRSTDEGKVKKIATVDSKIVAICSSRFKGCMYLFTFDLASGGNHQKLSFIESVLAGEGIVSPFSCSDPSVDVSFLKKEGQGLLTIAVPPPGELSDGFEGNQKEIIIRVDLKAVGMNTPNVKLTNILEGETTTPIKTTAKDLKTGLSFMINYPDGAIYLVEKR
ncbi:MAG: beta-galactosidase [candidate division Zixibacteria bacterium]|nr:beta-galactosidase [candidate division Zixibacteria bacterium]